VEVIISILSSSFSVACNFHNEGLLCIDYLDQCFSNGRPRSGTGPLLIKKNNLLGRGLTKVESHWFRYFHWIMTFSWCLWVCEFDMSKSVMYGTCMEETDGMHHMGQKTSWKEALGTPRRGWKYNTVVCFQSQWANININKDLSTKNTYIWMKSSIYK
jgi:hypothetical protein